MRRRFTDEQERGIIRDYVYGRLSTGELSKKYNCPRPTLQTILIRNGISRRSNSDAQRKYALNQSAFGSYDSEDTCYWLGFLYADGYVSGNRNSVSLSLSRKDRQHLVSFVEFLKSNAPIKDSDMKAFGKTYPISSFQLRSFELHDDLERHGIVTGRPFDKWDADIAETPNFRHWLRGLFDGDGACVLTNGGNSSRIMFMGSKELLDFIANFIKVNVGISSLKVKPHKGNKIYYLYIENMEDCRLIYHYMYDGSNIFLARKRDKIESSVLRETRADKFAKIKEQVGAMYKNGSTGYAISKAMGLSMDSVYQWIASIKDSTEIDK